MSEPTASDLVPSTSAPLLTIRDKRPSLTGLHKPTSSASLPDTGTTESTHQAGSWFPHVKKRAAKASSSVSSLDTSIEFSAQDPSSFSQRRLRLRKTAEQESASANPKSKRSEQRPQESSGSARASAHARLKKRLSGFQLKRNEEAAAAAEQSDLSEPSGLRQSLRKKKATGSCASNK